jgi:ribosomal protein L23
VSPSSLTMDQAVDAIFAIKPKDLKILASKPGKKK